MFLLFKRTAPSFVNILDDELEFYCNCIRIIHAYRLLAIYQNTSLRLFITSMNRHKTNFIRRSVVKYNARVG